MDASITNNPKIPQLFAKFVQARTIKTTNIKNPNMVLQNVIKGRDVRENITFEVSTGSPTETLNDGGTAKILFLAGSYDSETISLPISPNAYAPLLKARFWAETVAYDVVYPRFTTKDTVLSNPTMPKNFTVSTPVFTIMPLSKLPYQLKQ
jgi:hypothetical protein